MTESNTLITVDRLRKWGAREDIQQWFLDRYPYDKSEAAPMYQQLTQEHRLGDAAWLLQNVLLNNSSAQAWAAVVSQVAIATTNATYESRPLASVDERTHAVTAGDKAHAVTAGDKAHAIAAGYKSHAVTAGVRANATAMEERANAATAGYQANATTAGRYAHAAATGEHANATTAGRYAHATTSGDHAPAATAGDRANAAAVGEHSHASVAGRGSVAVSVGTGGRAKAGVGGAIMLAHRGHEGRLLGVKAAMVGEQGIEPDVWYRLDAAGEFERVDD